MKRQGKQSKTKREPTCAALSGHTGSALVWHTRERVFESRLVQQVLRFAGSVNIVEYVELGGTAHEGGGCDQSIGSTVPGAIVRSWLWSTALGVPHWAASVITAIS